MPIGQFVVLMGRTELKIFSFRTHRIVEIFFLMSFLGLLKKKRYADILLFCRVISVNRGHFVKQRLGKRN